MRIAGRVLAPFLLAASAWFAAPNAVAEPSFEDREVARAYDRAMAAAVPGPATVAIAGPAEIQLPKGFAFIPAKPAQHLLTAIGGSENRKLQGLIVPATAPQDWHLVVEYDGAGHVAPETARQWTSDHILGLLQVGAERANERRFEIRAPLLAVDRFIVPAGYDAGRQLLKFVSRTAEVGPITTGEPHAGVEGDVFGREGFVRLTMTLPERSFEAVRAPVFALLDAVSFKAGARSEDFVAGRHNVMSYPDLALFAGLAAADARIYANANGIATEAVVQPTSNPVARKTASQSAATSGRRPNMIWIAVALLAAGALASLGFAFIGGGRRA